MSLTINPRQKDVWAALDARTSPHSIDLDRDGITSRDLSRYYALIAADLRVLEAKFSQAERIAIFSVLQAASLQWATDMWFLSISVEDGIKYERLAEQFALDGDALVAKVSTLTESEMTAFADAAARWWQATGDGEDPEQGNLFVGIPR